MIEVRTSSLLALFNAALILMSACGGSIEQISEDASHSEDLRRPPSLSMTPDPIQAGSIAITRPVATGIGFGPGKSYFLHLTAGEAHSTAMQSISAWVTADKTGAIRWELQQDPFYGYPDALLIGPVATLTATENRKGSGWTDLTSVSVQVIPNPGVVGISPSAGRPGTTFAVAGSGAVPGAALTAQWYDSTGCTCWLAGCYGCTRTLQVVNFTADANGDFNGSFTPSSLNNGYCRQSLSVQEQQSRSIVATSTFSFCPQ